MEFIDLVKEAKAHKHSFMLWPHRWKSYHSSIHFHWTIYPFEKQSIPQIPDKAGVYAFLIQPRIASLDVSYLMYIGQTKRSLRKRFQEYLREATSQSGRPKVLMLLDLYKGFLYFSCATLNASTSLKSIEDELLNAFIPPMNEQYPAEVRRVIAAF